MKKLAIFDLDGTLLNTIDDLANAVNHALTLNGYPGHAIETYRTMVGNGVKKLVERAMPQDLCNNNHTLERILKDFREYYNQHLHDFSTPYPDIEALLNELHSRGVMLAVASNKYENAVCELMSHFFSSLPFVSVCGNIEGVPPKPDPSIVFRILSEHPTPKNDVIYVGDSAVDIETARRAGVTAVGVSWGFRPVSELESACADHIIDNPLDLLNLI